MHSRHLILALSTCPFSALGYTEYHPFDRRSLGADVDLDHFLAIREAAAYPDADFEDPTTLIARDIVQEISINKIQYLNSRLKAVIPQYHAALQTGLQLHKSRMSKNSPTTFSRQGDRDDTYHLWNCDRLANTLGPAALLASDIEGLYKSSQNREFGEREFGEWRGVRRTFTMLQEDFARCFLGKLSSEERSAISSARQDTLAYLAQFLLTLEDQFPEEVREVE